MWLADERFFREVYASLTLCALRTSRIKLGPCVTDPYSRHPALTAMAIATVDEISGQRAVLGMGAGVSGFRELGIARARSGVAMREAVELIRRLLSGEPVTYAGQTVRFDGGRLDFTPVRAAIPIYIASQHPVGCRAAGRVADGAIMQGCVAERLLAFFRDTVAAGARGAGRDPRALELVARINVCVHDDRTAARALMKPSSCAAWPPSARTSSPSPRRASRCPRPSPSIWRGSPTPTIRGPLAAAAAEVPEEFVDAVTLAGPPEEVAAGVIRLGRSGITEFMIYPMSPDGRVETTIERFQREVMPRVRAAGL